MQQEKTLKEIEREWRAAFADLSPLYQHPQDENRVLNVTPLPGNSAWVISIEGMPLYGALIAQVHPNNGLRGVTLILSPEGKSRQLRVPTDLSRRPPRGKDERLIVATQELVDWYYETKPELPE